MRKYMNGSQNITQKVTTIIPEYFERTGSWEKSQFTRRIEIDA
jgi:hypothetical protein